MTALSPRDRAAVFILLVIIGGLACAYTLHQARLMVAMEAAMWRDGTLGAFMMGVRHGLFCLGCCAALMLLLFAIAVMDLPWVAALTILVTAEKLLPGGRFWRAGIGSVRLGTGAVFLVCALVT